MELPFIEKLEDLDISKIQELIAKCEREDAFESHKVALVDKLFKLNAEHHKTQDDLKTTPNPRRFRQIRKAYLQSLLEIASEYKKLVDSLSA